LHTRNLRNKGTPVMVKAFDLIGKIERDGEPELDVVTVQGGLPTAVGHEKVVLTFKKIGKSLRLHEAALEDKNYLLAKVTRAQMDKFEEYTGEAWFKTHGTYRQIKSDSDWQALYGVEEIEYKYIDPKSRKAKIGMKIDVVFCRHCGVQMPLRLATVDHQAPQSVGAYFALCRFFRALGLTKGAGTGKKTQQYRRDYAADVGGKTSTEVADWDSRYTLNRVGRIYYSMLAAGKDWTLPMADRCMHSIFNLRPVCGPCNSSLGNYF
jgi:hypothetical protein